MIDLQFKGKWKKHKNKIVTIQILGGINEKKN